jgi:hypothetical protein
MVPSRVRPRAGTPELSLFTNVCCIVLIPCYVVLEWGDVKERNHSEDLDADGRIFERIL